MFSKGEIKNFQKKVIKAKKELIKVMSSCNKAIYTEQNEEELNDVKAFITSKINLLTEIETYINEYLQNKLTCSLVGFVANVMNYKHEYYELCQDERLEYLQKVYSNKVNKEILSI